jgi:hypothetical protein
MYSGTYHAFKGPRRFGGFWLDADTIIERSLELENIRTAAEEDLQGISVRVVLREKHGCARKGVCTACDSTYHGSGEVRQNLHRFEGDLVQDAGFVPITC